MITIVAYQYGQTFQSSIWHEQQAVYHDCGSMVSRAANYGVPSSAAQGPSSALGGLLFCLGPPRSSKVGNVILCLRQPRAGCNTHQQPEAGLGRNTFAEEGISALFESLLASRIALRPAQVSRRVISMLFAHGEDWRRRSDLPDSGGWRWVFQGCLLAEHRSENSTRSCGTVCPNRARLNTRCS